MVSFVKGQINGAAANLLNTNSSLEDEAPNYRRDRQWVRRSFIVPFSEGTKEGGDKPMLEETDILNRKYSSAAFKYTDSSLGGNLCINPLPQFTRYADIRDKGLLPGARDTTLDYTTADMGMGTYYSEAIDDHNQIIHMRFGVPSYNSLTQFFTGFYNNSAAQVARTGRVDDNFVNKFLKFGGTVIGIAIMPLAILPILFLSAGAAARFFFRIPSSKFYYLKPTMPTYWHAVSNMVNQLSVNRGLTTWTRPDLYNSVIGSQMNVDNATKGILSQIYPEFASNGVIDIYAVANRSKRLEMRHRAELMRQLSSPGAEGWYGKVRKVYSEDAGLQKANPNETKPYSLSKFWESWTEKAKQISAGNDEGLIEKDMRNEVDVSKLSVEQGVPIQRPMYNSTANEGLLNYFLANAEDGSDWASFRVDYTGPVNENFSNSSAPSAMGQKINSASSSARDIKLDYSGGLGLDPTGIAKAVMSGIGTVLGSVADTLHISGLVGFAGNAFVDIPEHWESSTSQMPKSTYTMTLISPYGNVISQMFNIYVPLCMILAGALPLATGKQSYQSPFLCELFDRGRSITRLGLIESISIMRGTSNLGFNKEGQAMAIEVSFSIKDLSSIMSMPIQQGMSLFPLEGIFDGDNAFTDYMMTLAGISLRDANDRFPILKRQLDTKIANYSSYFSKSRLAMDLGSMGINDLLGIFREGTNKK